MRSHLAPGWTRALALLASAALPAHAEVLVVDQAGGGDFTELQDAVDAAADGDTLLVRTGLYLGFTVTQQGLGVVEDAGEVAIVQGQVRVTSTMPDQLVLLAGLRIQAENLGDDTLVDGLVLQDTRGSVRVEDCDVRGAGGVGYSRVERGGDALHASNVADLSVVRCSLVGGPGDMSFTGYADNRGGDGLRVRSARVAVHDSQVSGGAGGPGDFLGCDLGGDGGHGARVTRSLLFASGSSFVGGDGGGDDAFTCQPGGNGVYLIGAGTQGTLLDLLLQGGLGACGAPDGLPLATEGGATATTLPGSARRFRMPNPVREGDAVDLVLEGVPGERAYVLVSDGPAWTPQPSLDGVLLLELPLSQGRRFLGTVPAGGVLTTTLTIPGLAPGEEAGTVFLQGLVHEPGVTARLASPETLLILDGSL